jgi:hypothetical protein
MRRIVEYPEDARNHALVEGYEYTKPIYYPPVCGSEGAIALLTIAATVVLEVLPDERRHEIINQSERRCL